MHSWDFNRQFLILQELMVRRFYGSKEKSRSLSMTVRSLSRHREFSPSFQVTFIIHRSISIDKPTPSMDVISHKFRSPDKFGERRTSSKHRRKFGHSRRRNYSSESRGETQKSRQIAREANRHNSSKGGRTKNSANPASLETWR